MRPVSPAISRPPLGSLSTGSPDPTSQTPCSSAHAADAGRRRVLVAVALLAIAGYGAAILGLAQGSPLLVLIDNTGSTLAGLFAAVFAVLAARRYPRGSGKRSWALLGLALGAWAGGDGYWAWSEIVLETTPTVPSWADIGYVLMAVLIVAAAATHPVPRKLDVSRGLLLLDVGMFVSALVAVIWTVALGPFYARLDAEPILQLVTVLYPVGSVTALFLLTMLTLRATVIPPPTRLLVGGIALVAAADVVYVVLAAQDSYTTGHLTDWFWFSGAVLIGLAAALDRPFPAAQAPARQIGRPWQFAAPAALLVFAGVVVWSGAGDSGGVSPSEIALAVAAVLLVVRMAVGYRDAVLVHQLYLERDREHEAARLAREEAALLQGVMLTSRELSHVLGNDLAVLVGWIDLMRTHPDLTAELQPLLDEATDGLDRATRHLRRLESVYRLAVHETPVGPALDLEQASRLDESPEYSI